MYGHTRALGAAVAVIALLLAGCTTLTRAERQQIAGKTVVITGASSGIGRGVALELASLGANVVLAARRTELLEQVARASGGRALVVTTDVARREDMERLAQAALARFGRIDVWINNAGVGALGRFEEVPLEDHLRVLEVNVNGVVYGSYLAMRQFREQGHGTLINIGSVVGRVPMPYYTSYVASKHAVIGLGAVLNQELRVSGVRNIHVVTINPFATDTPWFQHAANYTGHTPRSVLLDPPVKVVDAVVRATVRPRPEIQVGYKGNGAVAAHRIARTLTQALAARIIHDAQMQRAPPIAPPTTGALYEPGNGAGVAGGVARRMAAEEAAAAESAAREQAREQREAR